MEPTTRKLVFHKSQQFTGWACTVCEWAQPIPIKFGVISQGILRLISPITSALNTHASYRPLGKAVFCWPDEGLAQWTLVEQ